MAATRGFDARDEAGARGLCAGAYKAKARIRRRLVSRWPLRRFPRDGRRVLRSIDGDFVMREGFTDFGKDAYAASRASSLPAEMPCCASLAGDCADDAYQRKFAPQAARPQLILCRHLAAFAELPRRAAILGRTRPGLRALVIYNFDAALSHISRS